MSIKPEVLNSQYKQQMRGFIEDFLMDKKGEFSLVNTWGDDVIEKLLDFITQGKMIRGSLVLYILEVYSGKVTEDAFRVAAALEFLHSSLLIHDDIMDNDSIRREKQTIFAQYQSLAEKEGLSNAHHFGESMGICVGNIGFFLGFQLLSSLEQSEIKDKISDVCIKEMMRVDLAQMQDVYGGYTKDEVTEEDIEKVYIYKTGRYTFSLPMIVGALLAKQDITVLHTLEKLGEYIGVMFQLKDDELSLFGSQEVTGKPEGSDIRENKKTLYRLYLFEKASDEERQKLESIFRKGDINDNQLQYVRTLIDTFAIQKTIDQKIQDLHQKAIKNIKSLAIADTYKEQMEQFVEYLIHRTK